MEEKDLETVPAAGGSPAPGARKPRFRVTVSPLAPPAVEGGAPSDPAAPSAALAGGEAAPASLTEPAPPHAAGRHRTYFVYADTAEEARHRVREAKLCAEHEHALTVEEAGYFEHGVVHLPPEEEAAVRSSIRDGRKAPGT